MTGNQEKRQFVDTNIIIYAYNSSDPEKHRPAALLLHSLWNSGLGCLSIQVLQELYINLTRKIPHPLACGQAVQIIADLGRWRCHAPAVDSLIKAVSIEQRFQVSFWDAMIICSAQSMQCPVLWTEDFNHGQDYGGVKALNPFRTDFEMSS